MFPLRRLKSTIFNKYDYKLILYKWHRFAFSVDNPHTNSINKTGFCSPKDYIKECSLTFEVLFRKEVSI